MKNSEFTFLLSFIAGKTSPLPEDWIVYLYQKTSLIASFFWSTPTIKIVHAKSILTKHRSTQQNFWLIISEHSKKKKKVWNRHNLLQKYILIFLNYLVNSNIKKSYYLSFIIKHFLTFSSLMLHKIHNMDTITSTLLVKELNAKYTTLWR